MMGKKAFLICPVRGHELSETASTVVALEADGWRVYWPSRDTNQDDTTGYRICRDNMEAMIETDVVFVVWDGRSQGCLFDLGMAFVMNKSLRIISLPPFTDGKSFQNMIREWAGLA